MYHLIRFSSFSCLDAIGGGWMEKKSSSSFAFSLFFLYFSRICWENVTMKFLSKEFFISKETQILEKFVDRILIASLHIYNIYREKTQNILNLRLTTVWNFLLSLDSCHILNTPQDKQCHTKSNHFLTIR